MHIRFRFIAFLLSLSIATHAAAQSITPQAAAARLIKANPALIQLSTWAPRESLVKGIYTLHDPHGAYEPYAFEETGRLLRTNKGWQPIISGGGLGEPLANVELTRFYASLFASLRKEDAITLKFGNGNKSFALLTALDCPNCKQLERNLATVAAQLNATIYIYPMALDYTNAQRMNTVTSIWCRAAGAEKVWRAAMANPTVPVIESTMPRESCGFRTAEHARALARLFGSYGVPALISPSGEIKRGTLSPNDLLAAMK